MESVIARLRAEGADLPRRSAGKRAEGRFGGSAPKTRVIPCLRCSRPFPSEGAHNRVCRSCKHSSAWQSGPDFSEVMQAGA